MKNFACFGKHFQHLCSGPWSRSTCFLLSYFYHQLLRINPFSIQICYFLSLSFLGSWVLKVLNPRTDPFRPRNIDLFFTSVSATTVSSMSTVEMEVFSNTQLIVLTILMFLGGEIFTSMVGLHFWRSKHSTENKVDSKLSPPSPSNFLDHNDPEIPKSLVDEFDHNQIEKYLKYNSIKFLGFVVLGYFLVIQVLGVVFVLVYLTLVSSAREVLRKKGIKMFTFSLFTIVSTFASCGFVPTNESMILFGKNSGLLLILIPQILLGNTLYPPCLRFSIWVLGNLFKKKECDYLLKKTRVVGYFHLLPSLHSSLLVVTVFGFILIQFVVFCSLEWNLDGLSGLSSYERVVGVLFEVVNSRHTGETIVDLSTVAPAILVVFIVMMYLPPYTSFLPVNDGNQQHPQEGEGKKKRKGKAMENVIFSQLSYLVIFIFLICVTERKNMKEDPRNFNVLNIVVEVISAYGNVGFSTGYNCDLRIKPDPNCKNKWFGFSGKWSDKGKIILIAVMFFGRLKKFNMDGGKAWKLV